MRLALALLLATTVLVASCTGDDEPAAETGTSDAGALRIFAASSLEAVFRELAPDAEFRFASSEELADAALDGDLPDVFASAGQAPLGQVGAEGVLEPPVVFATNRLVLAVPGGGEGGVESLDDLAGADVLVGAELGYVRSTLAAIDRADLLGDAAFDPTAADQVASGAADAALVYYTDAVAAGDVLVIELPAQALVEYPIAVSNLSESFEAAEAFVELLLSDEGRQALEAAGFGVP